MSDSLTAAPIFPPAGDWPRQRSSLLDWLMLETSDERFIDNIFHELCLRLVKAGVPLVRSSLHFRILHPQWIGARILWQVDRDEPDIATFEHGVEDSAAYLESPINAIHQGAEEIRRSFWRTDYANPDFPFFADLRAAGITDYVAWPLKHTFGHRHVLSFATDAPEGFEPEHLQLLGDLMPALALVSEIRLKNRLARTLLETYVGPHASGQILAGATTRGSGVTVGAAILICDLRNFTEISDHWPRDEVIGLLNGYFDALCEPIEQQGGEILKFMGDGLLAIFPLDTPGACARALTALQEGRRRLEAANAESLAAGHPALAYGIGAHVGDVMYGNIGSRLRLDFTVIGPAVNTASRLETLTKEVGRPILVSEAFAVAAEAGDRVEPLGAFPLRGLDRPVEVYALKP
ncbi:adenylate cyclase [Rhizobium rhizosphaerae]|uniref:Adenylate cyclase n=1 Tax=Xaviernesmea rhizosphaerae TaxID=1672749 RepID=A0A1Q9AM93_9HYPH|nr:adenylate/guanylate cyclase domain-containing protein [Xaviernesmea rhizosphaerae]OLP56473.1 adenylate cyclase [Xaviernesmea rhizosphaerae]OQP87775.1 adenylate/guanylate cyclase domain-containing protein [Xaviernesmea rhizosphaerae]